MLWLNIWLSLCWANTLKTPASEAQTLSALKQPHQRMVRLGVVLGACGALTSMVPFIGLVELARVLLAPSQAGLLAVGLGIVLALFIGWLCIAVGLWLTHIADSRIQADLRRALVKQLGKVPLGWYSEQTSGAVRKAVQDDLDDLHHLIAHHQVELAGAVVLPLGAIAYLLYLDWRLALLGISTLPFYLLAYGWMMRGFGDKMQQLDAVFERISAAVVEFVQGIVVVKLFVQTGRAHANYQQAVSEFSQRYEGWITPIVRLEAFASLALSVPVIVLVCLSGGAFLLSNTNVAAIDVLATTLIAVTLPQTILTLSQGFTAQQKAHAAAKRIDQLLAVEPLAVCDNSSSVNGNDIQFDNVSFGYDDTHQVITDISLTCRAGTVTALVGNSGAGKSTLAKLVARFYDVSAGKVRIGGVDVRDIAPRELYRHVGFVLQETQLMAGTVADNLRLGCPDASMEQLEQVARQACIHERIMALPRGYQSVVGEDARFSGGEAQRISIARTLLADTPILILDEATAHADPDSEVQIQQALSRLVANRTVLVIAHKLHTIKSVDQIVVLDNGRMIERGSHSELLAAKGHYCQMWQLYQDVESNGQSESNAHSNTHTNERELCA